jgi:uncharacterized protein YcbX
MQEVGVVSQLWRYPVKSMGGERLEALALTSRGVHADRLWAIRDERQNVITGAKKLPALLTCSARFARPPDPDAGPGHVPPVIVRFPDGTEPASDDPGIHAKLSDLVGRAVRLCPLPPALEREKYRAPQPTQADLREVFGLADAEPLPDLSMFPLWKLAELLRYATPRGTYFDAYPIHLMTVASLRAMAAQSPGVDFDVRRFRPNILIETPEIGLSEFEWCGSLLHTPKTRIKPEIPTVRCSMPTRMQPGLRASPEVIKTICQHAERCLGVYATVALSGVLREGEAVHLELTEKTALSSWAEARSRQVKRLILRASAAILPKQ